MIALPFVSAITAGEPATPAGNAPSSGGTADDGGDATPGAASFSLLLALAVAGAGTTFVPPGASAGESIATSTDDSPPDAAGEGAPVPCLTTDVRLVAVDALLDAAVRAGLGDGAMRIESLSVRYEAASESLLAPPPRRVPSLTPGEPDVFSLAPAEGSVELPGTEPSPGASPLAGAPVSVAPETEILEGVAPALPTPARSQQLPPAPAQSPQVLPGAPRPAAVPLDGAHVYAALARPARAGAMHPGTMQPQAAPARAEPPVERPHPSTSSVTPVSAPLPLAPANPMNAEVAPPAERRSERATAAPNPPESASVRDDGTRPESEHVSARASAVVPPSRGDRGAGASYGDAPRSGHREAGPRRREGERRIDVSPNDPAPNDESAGAPSRSGAVSAIANGPMADGEAAVAPTARVNPSDQLARVLEMRDAAPLRPLSQLVLRLDAPTGGEDRVRVDVRGTMVGATLHIGDAGAAERLTSRIGELRDALAARGLEAESVRVQRTAPAAAVDAVTRANNTHELSHAAGATAVVGTTNSGAGTTGGSHSGNTGDSSAERRDTTDHERRQHGDQRQRSRRDQRGDRNP